MTGWMQTYTGKAFRPLDPDPALIDPEDIAHALGMLCRYGGHSTVFYSVAEHCVLMSWAVPAEHAAWALLHDATEAYMGDVIRPLKHSMPEYRHAEARLSQCIADRFELPTLEPPVVVHKADSRILLDERAAVLGPSPQPWDPAIEALEPLGVVITGWDPRYAEECYWLRMHQLGLA